jgi:glucose/mannose-6-phosphate isomerase
MLKDILRNFPSQFSFEPKIKNEKKLKTAQNFIVAGMGGSHLAADIIKSLLPKSNIFVHSDYGLPNIQNPENTLVIASSYSGNTEETIDALNTTIKNNIPCAIVASGGKLIDMANENNLPYIKIPDLESQPRFSLGYSFVSILKIIGENSLLNHARMLAEKLNSKTAEEKGKELAEKLQNKIPVIYSSQKYSSASYIWKIKFNETTKIPAFYNIFPELNHNEMTGFDTKEKTSHLMERFHFIFLKDKDDEEKNLNRMDAMKSLLEKQEFKVNVFTLEGESQMHKIFDSLMIADFASYYLAEFYSNDPGNVPMVEEFKKIIA